MESERIKRDTKTIGDRSEVEVMAALIHAGYLVSIPFGENHRYDLIAEKENRLYRVQVKTGRLRNGAIAFNCYSSHSHRNGTSCRSYAGEVDYFGVYCPQVASVYLVPIEDAATVSGRLRLVAPKNGQGKRIRWALPYLVAELPPEVGMPAGHGVPSLASHAPL